MRPDAERREHLDLLYRSRVDVGEAASMRPGAGRREDVEQGKETKTVLTLLQ